MRGPRSYPNPAPAPATADGARGAAFCCGRRPTRRRARHGLGQLLVALALAQTIGCDGTDLGTRSGHHSGGAAAAHGDSDFAWPDAPTHPVLELRIASPEASGQIQIELLPELAPETVPRIIALAEAGYYDGTTFHRVIPGFMIQGGDPNSRDRNPDNDGFGGFDPPLPDEFGEAPFVRGVVGLGNRGIDNSTSAQLFIMHGDDRSLDGRYTVIGRVLDGLAVVDRITRVEIDRVGRWGPMNRPIENVVIERARIVSEAATIRVALELERQVAGTTQSPPASPLP